MPSSDTQFKPGKPGGPGRTKGSVGGRAAALGVLDCVLSQAKNKKALKAAFQAEIDGNPTKFFRTYVMPLLPKNIDLTTMGEKMTGELWLKVCKMAEEDGE